MLYQETDVSNILKIIREKKFKSYYFLDHLFIDYLLKFNSSSNFRDKSFIIKNDDSMILCPMTIQNKNGDKFLNFFGNPFIYICDKENKEILNFFKLSIKKILISENISDLNLLIEKSSSNFFEIKKYFNKITNVKYINLSLEINAIRKGFNTGLKSRLNKYHQNLTYRIIDHENYKNEIFEMKEMHKAVSQKVTRSMDTWLSNETMILNNKGFLIKVSDKKQVISYSFFFNSGEYSSYFSSCTYRDFFKIYKNITHKTIFEALKYLQNKNCKKLILGETKIVYSNLEITDKEKNICEFKSSFGGEKFTHYYLNKKSLDLVDLY